MRARIKISGKILEIIPTTKNNTLCFASIENPDLIFADVELDFSNTSVNTPGASQDASSIVPMKIEVKSDVNTEWVRTLVKKEKKKKKKA